MSPRGIYKRTKEHLEAMSKCRIGKRLTDETRKKMSETAKRSGFGLWMLGRKQPKSVCKKISIGNKGKKRSLETKMRMKASFKKGKEHHLWKGGRIGDGRGYILLWTEEGYIEEHRFVMEKILGRKLTSKEQVHHINENRSDNRLENLQLCADYKEHMAIHRKVQEVENQNQKL